ncbi:MAG: DUF3073 domain-containing protein [Burkholderiaceae bacterium]|nr:DUF3073 domain-containing protein [Microbacteriaceae bacterium]
MGRGRQKAKHTKVARDLKYFSPDTNYGALQRELTHSSPEQDELMDKWADVAADPDAFGAHSAAESAEYDEDDNNDESDVNPEAQSKSA